MREEKPKKKEIYIQYIYIQIKKCSNKYAPLEIKGISDNNNKKKQI